MNKANNWRIKAAIFGLLVLGSLVQAQEIASPPEPSDYRDDNYRAPVPATLAGAKVVDTAALIKLLADNPRVIVIDVLAQEPRPPRLAPDNVWLPPPHEGIKGAVWLPNVGYGHLTPEQLRYFTEGLARISEGDKSRPLVLYCRSHCWMSWNAARRALTLGYRQVVWYPDGVEGWKQAGQPMAMLTPLDLGP